MGIAREDVRLLVGRRLIRVFHPVFSSCHSIRAFCFSLLLVLPQDFLLLLYQGAGETEGGPPAIVQIGSLDMIAVSTFV